MSHNYAVTVISCTGTECEVTVTDARSCYVYQVTIPDDCLNTLQRLLPKTSREDLAKYSFDFLLNRESPQAILTSFTLCDISLYFPEYPAILKESR